MKIVFMGTPDFAVPVLSRLIDDGHETGYVITQPDRRGNRGRVVFSPVKEKAIEAGIEVLQPDNVNSEEILDKIREFSPDIAVVVAYGQILKKELIDIPKYATLNVHASLLPKYRGASPMQRAILDGEERTGVTIMRVDEGLDTGDMLISASTEIDHKDMEEIHDELALMGADLISEAIGLIESGKAEFIKQDESLASYSGMIKKNDGLIDFDTTAFEIERKIRAFSPWPGAFTSLQGEQLKIWKAEAMDKAGDKEPGTVLSADKDGITVSCRDSSLIIKELQAPGKKRVKASDFLLGHDIKAGAKLG